MPATASGTTASAALFGDYRTEASRLRTDRDEPDASGDAAVAPAPGLFAAFARCAERQLGRPATFAIALLLVVAWAASGPFFGWSEDWQLIINTGTTIVTFLMVFVIQNTHSRDMQAIQLKLDELIRVDKMARNELISLEAKSEVEIEELKAAVPYADQNRAGVAEAAEHPRR